MCTKLSAKLQRLSADELAMEYALINANGHHATAMSTMGLSLYRLKGVMVRRFGADISDQLIEQAKDTLKMVGIQYVQPRYNP